LPAEVALQVDNRVGGRITTAAGMTLYARDRIRYPASGAHHARGGALGIVDVGMAIGTAGCMPDDEECRKAFKPLKAPAGAEASGYWTVLQRDDGTRQWAYQGYALYTYDGDKRPGDENGSGSYQTIVNASTTDLAPAAYDRGLYWRLAIP
jgi:predicted lipoprotein with Yx(FWY)xxD motif